MFNIANLPAVRAQLAQDAAAVGKVSAGDQVVVVAQEIAPEQAPSYPSKSLVLVDGRYRAVGPGK